MDPYLDPSGLQRLSADDKVVTSVERVKTYEAKYKNKSVSGNRSENFRKGRHTSFFLEKNNLRHFERHFAFQNA